MPKAIILIVDKDRILIDLLVRALSTPDLFVIGAISGDEGARMIDRYRPDLLVVDPSVENAFPLITSLHSGVFKTKIVAVVGTEKVRQRLDTLNVDTIVDRSSGLEALVAAIRASLPAIRASLPADLRMGGQPGRPGILICDDEDEIRKVLLEFLEIRGYVLSSAKNGLEALERLQQDPSIQMVLLDVSMPVMAGMDALKEIMNRDPHPSVIMLSGIADREIARQAIKVGAFDYILKPFDFAAIESSVNACLSYSEYQKQPWWKRLRR
jgi:DNA-binding NtrC family response regulator